MLRELCRQQGVELIEGYAMRDYIHMLLMIPPQIQCGKHHRFSER
ncbi:transposase [Thiolapillus sp.]